MPTDITPNTLYSGEGLRPRFVRSVENDVVTYAATDPTKSETCSVAEFQAWRAKAAAA